MFSKSSTSNISSTANTPGINFVEISSKSDEEAVLAAVGKNGSGGGPVVKTGNDCLEISSDSRPNKQYRYLKSQQTQLRKLNGEQRYETDTGKEVNERFGEG